VGAGKSDSVHAKQKVAKCMLVGDLMFHNVTAQYSDMMVECFQRIKTEQLQRVIETRHLGSQVL